jgi:hypothetical protein
MKRPLNLITATQALTRTWTNFEVQFAQLNFILCQSLLHDQVCLGERTMAEEEELLWVKNFWASSTWLQRP